jgi:hypothetical protein
LCFWFGQITRTTPRRRTILHLSQIRFTDALTFIDASILQSCNSAILLSLDLPDYPPAPAVGWHQLHSNPVAGQHADEIPVDPIRDVGQNLESAIVEPHAIHRLREHVGDNP